MKGFAEDYPKTSPDDNTHVVTFSGMRQRIYDTTLSTRNFQPYITLKTVVFFFFLNRVKILYIRYMTRDYFSL